MRGFLIRMIEQRLQRLAVGTALGLMLATTGTVATNGFDLKFDEADLAVEKAQVLLGDRACGTPGDRTTQECERHLRNALESLARARKAVNAAATAADGGTVSVTLP